MGALDALETLADIALHKGSATLSHPGYLAHMDPPSAPEAVAATLWMSSENQNLLHPDVAPTARDLEQRVMDWMTPFFFPHHPNTSGGHMVPGSTVANLTALWAAREIGGANLTRVVASNRAHNSVRKACDLLRLEYVEVQSCPRTHVLLPSSLVELGDLSNAALVLTAGTVATGAIDDLSILTSDYSGTQNKPLWTHIDAAWAGPLRLSPSLSPLLKGVERADSIGFSAHKWLWQPKGSALVLFKHVKEAHETMSYGGGYLATPTVGVLGTKKASALPLAACLLSWGQKGVAARLEADVARAAQLAELVEHDERFELWGVPTTGIVVWRPVDSCGCSVSEVRARLKGAWVSLTEIDGAMWFRSVATNPKADPLLVFESVAAAFEECKLDVAKGDSH